MPGQSQGLWFVRQSESASVFTRLIARHHSTLSKLFGTNKIDSSQFCIPERRQFFVVSFDRYLALTVLYMFFICCRSCLFRFNHQPHLVRLFSLSKNTMPWLRQSNLR